MSGLKVDVVIPTRNPSDVRPRLLEALRSAEWVNSLIFETSKPLSLARVNGARKASTEWIVMIDDDVELPNGWWQTVSAHMGESVCCSSCRGKIEVLAISTEIRDASRHDWAFRTLLEKFEPGYYSGNFDNHAYLIKRDVLLAWNPPPCFYCEDDLLCRFVKQNGIWLNLRCIGGSHWSFYHTKSRVPWAYYLRAFNLWSKPNPESLSYRTRTVRYVAFIWPRMLVAPLLLVYGGDLWSVFYQLRWCVQQLTGWIMAIMDGY